MSCWAGMSIFLPANKSSVVRICNRGCLLLPTALVCQMPAPVAYLRMSLVAGSSVMNMPIAASSR
jgi:hypothetical protein